LPDRGLPYLNARRKALDITLLANPSRRAGKTYDVFIVIEVISEIYPDMGGRPGNDGRDQPG
jgi:hypothetical protein